jgi:hypothetical protein
MESQRIVLPVPHCAARPVAARARAMMSAAFARQPVI